MALTNEQQAIELITRAKRILIVTRQHAPVDAEAAVAGLWAYLKKQGKDADAIIPELETAHVPSFLPTLKDAKPTISAMRSFLLTLDVSKTPLSELLYDVKDGKLEITIVPKSGEWSPKDVSFKHGEDRYDLIIAVDCPDVNSLGTLFQQHADFFYRTPVITIDRDPSHEHWGQLNLVDLTAVSSSEVLFGIFERWNRHLITEDVATALLAGMIAKTHSFRTPNVTPQTLQTASELVAMGAKREEIVHGLWRTRTVPMLKLWGRALSRLESDRSIGLVWTTLSKHDFLETGANEDALQGIVNELIGYSPEAKIIVFIYESTRGAEPETHVSIHTTPPYSAQDLGRQFNAHGSQDRVEFTLPKGQSLIDGSKEVITKLREFLSTLQK